MKIGIGDVSLWMEGHAAPDAVCISVDIGDAELHIHGSPKSIAGFRDAITAAMNEKFERMAEGWTVLQFE